MNGGLGRGMGQVTITLNGRSYVLACRDDEEERLLALSEYVRTKIDKIIEDFGQIGNERILLMSALLITDELFEMLEMESENQKTEEDEPYEDHERSPPY